MTPFKPKIRVPGRLFNQAFDFSRPTQAADNAGGRVITGPDDSPVVYANVMCSLQPGTAEERQYFGRLESVISDLIFTKTQMSLMNGDFGFYQGRVFTIHAIRNIAELGNIYVIAATEMVKSAQ